MVQLSMPIKGRKNQPAKLSDILTPLLRDKGWDTIVREYRAVSIWSEVVGPYIARNTLPQRIDRGVLFVIVRGSALLQELSFMKDQIAERINGRLPEPVVRDIRFAQGEIPEREEAPAPSPRGKETQKGPGE
jgi:predicted nucleic acid-binding Zn ribbon protein